MKEGERPGQTKAEGEAYVNSLYHQVLQGGESAEEALGQLSGMTMARDPLAQERVREIDSQVEEGKLTLPRPQNPLGTDFGGVPKEAWSQADQERLARGDRPRGHPCHPNV